MIYYRVKPVRCDMCTKDWYGIFSTALHKECFTQGEIQQIYKIEMEARIFFDFGEIVPDFLIRHTTGRIGSISCCT